MGEQVEGEKGVRDTAARSTGARSTVAWRREHCSLAMANGATKLIAPVVSPVLKGAQRGEGREAVRINSSILHCKLGLIPVLIRFGEEQGAACKVFDEMCQPNLNLKFCNLFPPFASYKLIGICDAVEEFIWQVQHHIFDDLKR